METAVIGIKKETEKKTKVSSSMIVNGMLSAVKTKTRKNPVRHLAIRKVAPAKECMQWDT
ncbi:hypothetical protein ACFL6Y_07430 [Elusimicrobiota bacterium]